MLIDQWITWAEKRYLREQTSRDLLYSVLLLRDLFGLLPARAIGPRKVAEAQKRMAIQGKTRQGILKSTGHIRQLIAWGVAQAILKPDRLVAIRSMQPLRYGAIDAPESKKSSAVRIHPCDSHLSLFGPLHTTGFNCCWLRGKPHLK